MIGDKYNDWTIIGEAEDRIDKAGKHHKRVLCQCKCGNIQVKDLYKLKKGAQMCKKCYLQIVGNNGVPFKRKYNKYEFKDNIVIGHINNSEITFTIDSEDFEKIKNYCWHCSNERVYSTINKKRQLLHRFILGLTDKSMVVDHINRNPLDNRKQNLRVCSQSDNSKNRSLYKNNKSGHNGICYSKRDNKWYVYIDCNKKHYNCGQFDTYEEALKIRIDKEQELFGEYAPL